MVPAGDIAAAAGPSEDARGVVDAAAREALSLRELFEQALGEDSRFEDVFIVDLVVRGHKGTRVVETFIDSDESLTIERVAAASRMLGNYLDQNPDLIDGAFRLEVSSPGPKRSLLVPRQYRKHVGRTLTLRCDRDSNARTTGVLTSVDEEGITLEVGGEQETITYNQILEGKVALPW